MNECFDYKNDPQVGKRRIVCAAMINQGIIVLGARHYDKLMHEQIKLLKKSGGSWNKAIEIQGFIDQWDNFINREDALIVALAAGQRIKRCGGDENRLYSENLY